MDKENIPLYKPQNVVGEEILGGILEVLRSGWLTMGPKTEQFEKIFASFIGRKFGLAANSCTSALFMSLDSLGIRKGDQVVVPVMTFVATANVVRWSGGEPIFCDVSEDGEIDPDSLEEILEENGNVKCIIPVHLYGFPCDMERISSLATKYSVKMIEDCAQAHGATVNCRKVGSFGDASCFSFYATKNMTMGEGGIMLTDERAVLEKACRMRNHGQTKIPREKAREWHYDVVQLGFNFRMNEIQAVMGISQMERLDAMIESRWQVAQEYKEELRNIRGIELLHEPEKDSKRHGVYHLLVIRVGEEYPLTRDELYIKMRENGITCGVHYPPLHYLTYYKQTTGYKEGDFPCAERLYSCILSLPFFPFMKDSELDRIVEVLRK